MQHDMNGSVKEAIGLASGETVRGLIRTFVVCELERVCFRASNVCGVQSLHM